MKLLNWKPWFPHKQNQLLVKVAVGFLLMGLAFRLLFIRSTDISPEIETPFPQETHLPQKVVASEPLASVDQMQQTGNFFTSKTVLTYYIKFSGK